jgi:type I restriction enzyme, S subunit
MSLNIVPLKDLCNNYKTDIVDGPFGANLKREHYKEEGIPVLKIQNIKSFNITLKKMDYVDQAKFDELRRHSYINGDIVMTKLGNPLGESAIVEGLDEGLIVADLVRIRTQKIDTQYLCYHLNSPVTSAYINSQQKGTTRPRVRIAVVRDLPIYTPSLAEQQRIVAVLDQAFAEIGKARANAEQNLKNARELFDSYLQQVFSQRGEGWVETKLVSIAENLDSKRVPITKSERTEGEYPYYGASGIVDHVSDFLFDEELLLISEDGANLLARTYPIAFSASGKYWVNNHAHVLRFKNSKEQKFIEYYLNSISLFPYVSGMAQPKLNQKSLNNIPVPMANPTIINEVVEKLNLLRTEIEQLKVTYKAKIKSLDELKKSLLQKAFTGELTKNKGMAA